MACVKPTTEKYVDDQIHLTVVNMRAERTMIDEEGKFYKTTRAPQAQSMFSHIVQRATDRGMVVNDAKLL